MNRASMGNETPWIVGLVAGALIICLMLAAYQIGWSRGRSELRDESRHAATKQQKKGAPQEKDRTAEKPTGEAGKQLFASKCGSCHTLSAAGTDGTTGPNLDQLAPNAAIVLAAIKDGGSGSGVMPKNLYTGKRAQQVADFVAQATGN